MLLLAFSGQLFSLCGSLLAKRCSLRIETMKTTSTLKRNGTDLTYKVVHHGHWSDIVNNNDETDTDSVKWYGNSNDGKLYVSCTRGFSYTVLNGSWLVHCNCYNILIYKARAKMEQKILVVMDDTGNPRRAYFNPDSVTKSLKGKEYVCEWSIPVMDEPYLFR